MSSSSSSRSSSGSGKGHNLTDRLVDLLRSNPDGVSNELLEETFGSLQGIAPVLNTLLSNKRVNVFHEKGRPDSLIYQLVPEETAVKFEGLGPEQMLVYQICERAGNHGIWTRDIKAAANIPQHTLTKTLKLLEQRSLVKSVRSVVSKSKKLYMLFSATPAKEITGGPWYTDQEFDHAFVDDLTKMILGIVKLHAATDSRAVLDRLTSTGVIETNCLSQEELETVMRTMVYDGKLEEVHGFSSETAGAAGQGGIVRYKVAKEGPHSNYLTETPCGNCAVISQCCEGGVISPTTCPLMDAWLNEF